MNVERLACAECGKAILPQTAATHAGMCAQCGRMPEALRKERREFEHALANGAVFRPSAAETRSAKTPAEFGASDTVWSLDPEYHADDHSGSVADVIARCEAETSGNVFLISSVGSRLNLSFTATHGVCEYRHEKAGDWRYAYTERNLVRQVPAEQHVAQACPCCGVGMSWFPSRFHMPRPDAFAIVLEMISGALPTATRWLTAGDFSVTVPGRG